MRDISSKVKTLRTASATATLLIHHTAIKLLRDQQLPKGDPLPVAKVAAIQAAKNTSLLIPYCHPLPIDFADCRFEVGDNYIRIETEVKAIHKTGVEMEALTAASMAALTIYDMLKMVDESIRITEIKLLDKKGGKSNFKSPDLSLLKAAVLVLSDTRSSGKGVDTSGQLIKEYLMNDGVSIVDMRIIPDDPSMIEETLLLYSDTLKLDLVLTTGGTGIGPRDNTVEVMQRIIEKEIFGISEAMRSYGQERTPFAMFSRGKAGIRGKTLIVNFPGSTKGVKEALAALFPAIYHTFKMLKGEGHDE